ncbi:MAG: pyridoxamine 5'-phosphate oxidase family protein [Acetobacteraceae bacterium]|nr:pyridoxamine 5'-phosphate oxidase family protein [Acetobacteraceae bacterium]
MRDPFHRGERLAQARAGVRVLAPPIREAMPDQHRSLFAQLPILFAAVADPSGWPVATALAGPPGFVSSPDERTLQVACRPAPADPAGTGLHTGAPIGLLGLDFATRRRNRANGVVVADRPGGFSVSIRQSFGNCPQYIQTRFVERAAETPAEMEAMPGLDGAARTAIETADTFLIASSSGPEPGEAAGLDMSHRGGRPGFVRVDGDVLTVPDFRGNRYFNTLGNLLLDDRAGLLFVDFPTGDTLQLQGRAEILWEAGSDFPGAERLWRLRVTAAWRRRRALPLRWRFGALAPQNERTGTWERLPA